MTRHADTGKAPRQSNFELLRIVAMMLVLIVHADFLALGHPTGAELHADFAGVATRIVIQSLALCCVDVFFMISGWFAIRPTLRGLANFLFQCLWFYAGIWIVMTAAGAVPPGLPTLAEAFRFNWFIPAYLVLFILSPALNLLVEHSDKRRLAIIIISFFAVEFGCGLTGLCEFFTSGYSPLSAIGLYLLARWMRLYLYPSARRGAAFWFLAYLGCSAATAAAGIAAPSVNAVYSYISPLCIGASAALLMWAARLKTGCRPAVNAVAASCFAIYLLHTDPLILGPRFVKIEQTLASMWSGPTLIGVSAAYIIVVAAVAIFLDIPRRIIWNKWKDRVANTPF